MTQKFRIWFGLDSLGSIDRAFDEYAFTGDEIRNSELLRIAWNKMKMEMLDRRARIETHVESEIVSRRCLGLIENFEQ